MLLIYVHGLNLEDFEGRRRLAFEGFFCLCYLLHSFFSFFLVIYFIYLYSVKILNNLILL